MPVTRAVLPPEEEPAPSEGRFGQLKRLILYRLFVASALFLLTQRGILVLLPAGGTTALGLKALLAAFFSLSVLYLIWLRTRRWLGFLARVQCALDPMLITALVVLTGGQNSPLFFLYGLTVLTTAMLLGRRDALLVAGAVWLLSLSALPFASWLFDTPVEVGYGLLRQLVLHGMAYLITALVAGTLAEKAKGLESAVALQQDSLAGLAALNRQIVEAIPYGLVTVNDQGVIRTVSDPAVDMLPKRVRDPAGHLLSEIFPELGWVVKHADMESTYMEMALNDRILGVTVSPLRDHRQGVIGTLIVLGDQTEMKRLEGELAARERLALAGRMAAVLAHEIRNPLASLQSATQMMAEPGMEGHRERMMEIILEEVGRLKRLTTDFLQFSRPTPPVPQAIRLADFLKEMAEKIAHDPAWGESRRLVLELADDVVVSVDPDHLWQVFWNLLVNAAQVTPVGGVVTVRGERLRNRVRVLIEDSGPGMDPETIQRALEPFFTTRAAGTGLGLAVVDQLMRRNKGRIHLRNIKEGGLQVTLVMEPG